MRDSVVGCQESLHRSGFRRRDQRPGGAAAVPQLGRGTVQEGGFRHVLAADGKRQGGEGSAARVVRSGPGRFFRQGTDHPRDGCRHLPGGGSSARADPSSHGPRASCAYHGARASAPKLRRSSSARPSSVPILLRSAALTFRRQKHDSSTYARNNVSTKFTIAFGSCLKQWSRPQCADSVLKQSFSTSQRRCPARHTRRVLSCRLLSVAAQNHSDVSSFCCHLPPTRSRRRTVSTVCTTRNGRSSPSAVLKPSASQHRTVRRPSCQSCGACWANSPRASCNSSRCSPLTTTRACLPWSRQKLMNGASRYKASPQTTSKKRP